MSQCIVCNTNPTSCSCNMCSGCKAKIKEIQRDPWLTPEEKEKKIQQLYAGNNSTR